MYLNVQKTLNKLCHSMLCNIIIIPVMFVHECHGKSK